MYLNFNALSLLHAPPSASLPLIFRANDEPVDPKRELEDRCKAPCARPLKEYQACAKRIQGDESGHKHCTGQYFDYWRCVDNCAATKLFWHLK
ncbi:cytochrome b-c1 complex subunit 6-1, mitochondrial-like [Primulina huaijiensis]|uniref:cytochrome b-c1 complex subunit 6-1, mitochondrial-like n=1 Tax=Primulina huaijiensis TaxID=1492673 RepID=UPI003CC71BD1